MLKRIFTKSKKTDDAANAPAAPAAVPSAIVIEDTKKTTTIVAVNRSVHKLTAKVLFPDDEKNKKTAKPRQAGSCFQCSFPFQSSFNGPCSGSFSFTYVATPTPVATLTSVLPGCFTISAPSVISFTPTSVTISVVIQPTSCLLGSCSSTPPCFAVTTGAVSVLASVPVGVTGTALASGLACPTGTITVTLTSPSALTTANVSVPVLIFPFKCFCNERSCHKRKCDNF